MNVRNASNFKTFSGGNGNPAPRAKRYIGKYYWCMYWRSWDKIVGYDAHNWYVQSVDNDGNSIGEVRSHCTDIDPGLIADRPFKVEYS